MPDFLEFLILALAAYRITRLFTEDHLLEGFRNWVWKRFPPETTKLGYWLSCPWCFGFAASTLLVLCYILVPEVTLLIALIFALSAVVGIISTQLDK